MTEQIEISDKGSVMQKNPPCFTHGTNVWVNRGNMYSAVVVVDYRPSFDAIKVRYHGSEWTFRSNEVLSYEQHEAVLQERAKKKAEAEQARKLEASKIVA